MSRSDPCVQVCEFDGRTGWCFGCGLTVPEIRSWSKLTPYRRTELQRELPRRTAKLRASREAAGTKR